MNTVKESQSPKQSPVILTTSKDIGVKLTEKELKETNTKLNESFNLIFG